MDRRKLNIPGDLMSFLRQQMQSKKYLPINLACYISNFPENDQLRRPSDYTPVEYLTLLYEALQELKGVTFHGV